MVSLGKAVVYAVVGISLFINNTAMGYVVLRCRCVSCFELSDIGNAAPYHA
jgi:hypothetical protein